MEVVLCMLIIVYLVPFVVAAARDSEHTVPILIFNAALGWTGVGWFAALAWAFVSPVDSPDSPKRRRAEARAGHPLHLARGTPRTLHERPSA